ncbi:tetratricopeptide repeat protein 28-like isoform X2 [Orbicella faveolata]|nr:tetratricopeptide repeat protein 28-like isoform X2 [Orbicella faveolata]
MDNIAAIFIGILVAHFLLNTGRGLKAIELCKECVIFLNKVVLRQEPHFRVIENFIYQTPFKAYRLIRDYKNAIKYGRKLILVYRILGEVTTEGALAIEVAEIYERQGKRTEAKLFYERAISIMTATRNRQGLATAYGKVGTFSFWLNEYAKAQEYLSKAIVIRVEIGDREGEAKDRANLGIVFQCLGNYRKAKEYQEKSLAISIQIGNRYREARAYLNLGTVFQYLGQHFKAKEYLEKALTISIEIGDRKEEAEDYGDLGVVLQSLGEYMKAKEYLEKALVIYLENGDRNGEANVYGNLGSVFQSLGEYIKAKEYLDKALAIRIEIGDRNGEAAAYGNLGHVFQSLGEYIKAKEYLEKALAIRIEIGDRNGEAADYGILGNVFVCLGEYAKAAEYLEKALAIRIEIGDRKGEAADYGSLATVFLSLGEYVKAKEYLEKGIKIRIEIGDRQGEAADYGNLGHVFQSLGEPIKAKEYLEKALAIDREIGDRNGEAGICSNLGSVFQSLGEYVKAKDYLKKALAMTIEIGDRNGEAATYLILGVVFVCLGEYGKATKYLEKSLSISRDIEDAEKEFQCLNHLGLIKLLQGKIQEAVNCLQLSIKKSEHLRNFLQDNDQFKISFSDVYLSPYHILSVLFCSTGNHNDALYAEELGRARALADLMADQYSIGNKQMSSNPQSWIGIENIMRNETNCACLYITYYAHYLFLWILKTSGVIHFRQITANEDIFCGGLVPKLEDFFSKSFRSFGILPEEDCEDRSLNSVEPKLKSSREDSDAAPRLVEEDDGEGQHYESALTLCYRMLISPVADLLGNEEPEIIIVPHRFLYKVPFAALQDANGKYLSETLRLRIVPSLTTLKLIQDSPAEYHSETGALVVGDPKVGRVFYRGSVENFKPLEFARAEAKMVGQLMGVQPLLGEQATKQAVLDMIHCVSLVHFAAHGNAERGEIALAPTATTVTEIPDENDYLLTTSDISRIQLRAKLVVLSCCHSGRGQIRAEGVVGIARAFLGSGARSVLVARWALGDKATEQLMRCFYKHLADGESASESLHEAMKWMRGNGFPEVADWAPFMLIGDNVTIQFGNVGSQVD